MISLRIGFVYVCLFLFGLGARAQQIPLQNLSDDDMKKVVGDLGTNFLHSSVSGAGTLGHIFGFELGLVAGQTNTPHLNDVATANTPAGTTVDASKLYDAEILGVVTVPAGVTVEGGFVPKVGKDSFKFSAFALAVKWTPTEVFLDLPVSLAVKGSYTRNDLAFSQTISGVPVNYTYSNTETALTALVSKDLAIFEPYFGLGYVTAKGDLSATTSVFNTGATSGNVTRSGTQWMLGTEVKLLALKLGVEYMNLFNTSRVMGKLSFYF